ncbi:conserved hypothetical protein [Paraburkholderia ribeironis]|uniref:Uncharacterized protein n=1 Tax=Paraburkholderia ribeironis TaxID=1247936 RepID=A0A1N7SCX3_9BURK|nr:conserved hypothetical protein [Paraburkholderia ribeironis]
MPRVSGKKDGSAHGRTSVPDALPSRCKAVPAKRMADLRVHDGLPGPLTLVFLPSFERRQCGLQPFDPIGLRRHPDRAGNRIDTVAPIGQRNAVCSGDTQNNVFQMLNIFFELMMIHCFPRDSIEIISEQSSKHGTGRGQHGMLYPLREILVYCRPVRKNTEKTAQLVNSRTAEGEYCRQSRRSVSFRTDFAYLENGDQGYLESAENAITQSRPHNHARKKPFCIQPMTGCTLGAHIYDSRVLIAVKLAR